MVKRKLQVSAAAGPRAMRGRLADVCQQVGATDLKSFYESLAEGAPEGFPGYDAALTYHGKLHRDPPTVYLARIIEKYPEINPDFLLTGRGPIERSQQIATSAALTAERTTESPPDIRGGVSLFDGLRDPLDSMARRLTADIALDRAKRYGVGGFDLSRWDPAADDVEKAFLSPFRLLWPSEELPSWHSRPFELFATAQLHALNLAFDMMRATAFGASSPANPAPPKAKKATAKRGVKRSPKRKAT